MTFNIFKNNKYITIENVLEDLDSLYVDKYFQEKDNTDGIVESDLLAKIAIREELLRNLSK